MEFEVSSSRGEMIHHEFKGQHDNSLFKCIELADMLARSKAMPHETPSKSKTHPPITPNLGALTISLEALSLVGEAEPV